MDLYCLKCNKVTVVISAEERARILNDLHGPADSKRMECPICHQYQWEIAARMK